MGLFRRNKPTEPAPEHAVILHLPLTGSEFGTEQERENVFALESRIRSAADAIGAEHDGNEFGDGEAVTYSYGPDADELFDTIRRCLVDYDLRPGSYAIKRHGAAGNPDARQERVELG